MKLLVHRNNTGKFLKGDVVGFFEDSAAFSPKELLVFRVVTVTEVDSRLVEENTQTRVNKRRKVKRKPQVSRRLNYYLDDNDNIQRR